MGPVFRNHLVQHFVGAEGLGIELTLTEWWLWLRKAVDHASPMRLRVMGLVLALGLRIPYLGITRLLESVEILAPVVCAVIVVWVIVTWAIVII